MNNVVWDMSDQVMDNYFHFQLLTFMCLKSWVRLQSIQYN